ncbi:MAG: YbaN family protein [Actinobacteria bacterium]|nr:YbaN family protein [Actinomycetota bacterium]
MERSVKKYLLILAGSISLVLGILGIVIPVLPTTPFLLLTSFCYLRSSKRLYDWMLNNRVFGPYIYNYLTCRAIKRSVKVVTLIILWLTLAVSIVLVSNVYLRIFLVAVGVGVSIHVLSLKTLHKDRSYDGGDSTTSDTE